MTDRPRGSASTRRTSLASVLAGLLFLVLLVGGGVLLWQFNRDAQDSSARLDQLVDRAGRNYVDSYMATTTLRAETLFDGVFAQLDALAGPMQTLIDNPEAGDEIAAAVTDEGYFADRLHYNPQGNWVQNRPGAPSVVSVWGYLLGDDHMPRPEVWQVIKRSSIFDLFAVSTMATGPDKLQVYYLGPKDIPILRTAPATNQAETFDKVYPGHNEANFWDFFYPGLYEDWVNWQADPASRPVASDITGTAPYVDAVTGNTIVSYFRPLWSKDRTGVEGLVGIDITLDQLSALIDEVRVAESGFAFLAMSNGNVIAVNRDREALLGLSLGSADDSGGVFGLMRDLHASKQPAIASLELPQDSETSIVQVTLEQDGRNMPYLIALRRLHPVNLWNSDGTIVAESFVLGFVVPEGEIFAAWNP